MDDLLQQYEAVLLAKGIDVEYALGPSARVEVVQAALAETGYLVPPALLALYTWRNGTNTQNKTEFLTWFATLDSGNQQAVWPDQTKEPAAFAYRATPFFPETGAFMPLHDATFAYREAQQEDFWPANFWPIFHDDSLLLDINPASNTYGQVHLQSYSLLIMEPEPYYDSLESMFTTYLEALRSGLVPFEPELEPGFSQYRELAAQLNPLSAASWCF